MIFMYTCTVYREANRATSQQLESPSGRKSLHFAEYVYTATVFEHLFTHEKLMFNILHNYYVYVI